MQRRDCLRIIGAGLSTLFPLSHGLARGSTPPWPQRALQFIVPLAAGGGLDVVARLVAKAISPQIGQQVVVENRTGAGGQVGIADVIRSPPDGYTFLLTNDNVVSAPYIFRLSTFYLDSLVPVVLIAKQPQCLAVHGSLQVHTVAEFIALAKAKPGMGCATSGIGSNQHVLLEWFSHVAGIRLQHIPYRGAGEAINDLVAGQVKVAFLAPTVLLPYTRDRTLRILAQASERRFPGLTDVPTFQEAGFRDLVLDAWYAAFAPTGTPAAIIMQLNGAINRVLEDEHIKEFLQKTATEVVGGTGRNLATFSKQESEKYSKLVTTLNIKIN